MDNTEDILKNYRGKYSQFWIERWGLIPELPTSFDNANSIYELVSWLQRAFKNLLDDFQQLEAEFEDFKNALIDLLEYLIPELIRRYHDSAEFRTLFISLLEDILAGEERNWVKDLLKELLEVDMRGWIEDYLKDLLTGFELQEFFDEVFKKLLNDLENQINTNNSRLLSVESGLADKANKNEVTNVMIPKGSIAYASLPTTGNTVGWYYYCPDGDGTNGAGNYVWNGAVWYFGGNSDNGYNMLLNKVNKNISNLKSGYETLDAYATFKQGRIANGVFLTDIKYRVATDDIIQFDREVVLRIANGFEISFNIFVGGVYSNPTVPYTDTYIIPKNTQFKIVIKRVTENTAELANVNEFVNAVTFSTLIEEKIGNTVYSNSDTFGFVNDYYINKTGIVQSYPTGGLWKYGENYLKIDDVDSFSMTGRAGASSIAYYDVNLNFVGNEVVSDTDESKMISSFVNKPVDAVYFRVSLYTPTENTFKVVFKDLKKIVQSLGNDFLDFKTDLQASVLTADWKGKKCGFIGDSVTFGLGSTKPFSTYLAEKLGIIPYNYGQNGATMHGMEGQVSSLISEHPDVDAIFIFGGTNDYNSDTPLGTFYTESDAPVNVNGVNVTRKLKTIPTNSFATFCDRLNKILYLTKTNFPNAKVILMTPLHRGYATFGTSNVQPPEVYANGLGLYIEDYVDKVIEASSMWSCSLINLFRDSGLYPVSSAYSQFFSNASTDMLHPNTAGHAIIAKVIEGELRRIIM